MSFLDKAAKISPGARILKGDFKGAVDPWHLIWKKKAAAEAAAATGGTSKTKTKMACGGRGKMKKGGGTTCRGMGAAVRGGKFRG